MSGVAHAVGKVFKGIGKVIKKVWKPLVIAAAIYFTGGLALGAMGAMSAGGGILAGAGAGLEAAAGGIGIGAGAGIGGAFAAGAGTAAAAGGAAAGLAGLGAATGTEALTDWGAAAAAGGAADAGGTMGGVGMLTSLGGDAAGTGGLVTGGATNVVGGGSNIPGSAPSSMWDSALSTAKNVMGIPGMPGAIGGLISGYEQGQMFNKALAYKEAHAPGQLTPGATKDSFGGFAKSGNTDPLALPNGQYGHTTEGGKLNVPGQTPMPGILSSPLGSPFDPTKLPGVGQSAYTNQMPGYGLPGYGVQPGNQQQQQAQQYPGLLSSGPPFMENPYEETI